MKLEKNLIKRLEKNFSGGENEIEVFAENCEYKGFYCKAGATVIIDGSLATNGTEWNNNSIFYLLQDGIWEKIEIEDETLSLEIKDFAYSLKYKPLEKIYTGSTFTECDIEPGEKCHDGGEYGFYTRWEKTSVDGLYRVETYTTCDFDSCGTGYQEYQWVTE